MFNFCRRLAVLSGLLVAACQSTPAPPALVPGLSPSTIPGLATGIDMPTSASDVLAELRGSRLNFVARYYREPTSRWPGFTAREAKHLSSLGLNIVTVWESHSGTPSYFSYPTGYNDALSAYRQAYAAHQPPGSAIYFAVDFNARGPDMYFVDQYFRGIAAGMYKASGGRPVYRVGVYGSGSVCDAMRRAGLAQYTWLSNSTAWIGTQGYSGWNIRQRGRLANLSFNHDFDEAREDYGGFRVAN